MEPKILKGAMQYEISITEDIDVRFEQSNENHLVAFIAVQRIVEEMWEVNNKKGINTNEANRQYIISDFFSSNIPLLAKFVMDKYKDAVPEEKKVKIDIVQSMKGLKK